MRFTLISCVFLLIMFTGCRQPNHGFNETMDLSGTWNFQLDSANVGIQEKWFNAALNDSLKLPGTTDENKKGIFLDEKAIDRLSRVWYWKGAAWYQKELTIPENWAAKNVKLLLERTKDTHVWFDDIYCGYENTLSAPQFFDLSKAVKPGKHRITVLVDNAKLPPVGPSHAVDERTQTNWNGVVGRIELQATDPCGFDNNGATVKLPPNPNGYRVYARVLAKPTDEPAIGLYSSLNFVQDENGYDLLYLGQVTSTGFSTPSFEFTRTKGQSKAVDISGMFQWSGTVCYFAEPTDGFSSTGVACCVDSNADDIFEECMSATGEPPTCPAGYEQVTTYCKTFTAEWIFNVSDYVSLLLGTSNSGVKLLQIRFYPN